MADPDPPPEPHNAGGTYGQGDVSLASERSRFRQNQNYRATSAELDEELKDDGAETLPAAGSQMDSGTS